MELLRGAFASIDQLDKTDPPAIPEGYVGTLALSCLVHVVDGISAIIMPIYMATGSAHGASTPKDQPPPSVDVGWPPQEARCAR